MTGPAVHLAPPPVLVYDLCDPHRLTLDQIDLLFQLSPHGVNHLGELLNFAELGGHRDRTTGPGLEVG